MLFDRYGDMYSWSQETQSIYKDILVQQVWFQHVLATDYTDTDHPFFITGGHDMSYYSGGSERRISAGRKLWDYAGLPIGLLVFDIDPNDLIILSDEFLRLGSKYDIRISITGYSGELVYDSDVVTNGHFDRLNDQVYMLDSVSASGLLKAAVEIPQERLFAELNTVRILTFVFGLMWLTVVIIYLLRIKHLQDDVYVLEIKQKEARLAALRAQINPHMLFNTLESIRMQAVVAGSETIAAMVKALARMFRHSLAENDSNNTVQNELDYAADYTALQNVRYGDMIHLEEHLSTETKAAHIIPMLFQPLVENSIKHGLKDRKTPLHISICEEPLASARTPGLVRISVSDDGLGVSAEKLRELNGEGTEAAEGIGLKNIDERLRLKYGTGLHIKSEAGRYFTVEVAFCIQ
jgi:two-component system sensor histidine kinase YesM